MARVLIVDDSTIMRKNLKTVLTQAGHTVVGEAIDGGQAHLMYRSYLPDLVTMDITMPKVNGIEAVKMIIKEFPEAKIVMISALDQRSMVLEALKEGAKHYIIKPINHEKVIMVVNKVLDINVQKTSENSEENLIDTNPPREDINDPFVIENIDNTFHIILSPSLNEENFASLTQAIQGLLFVKPLKVVFNFGRIETLPDPLLAKAGDMVKAIRNAKGFIKVVARNKDFIQTVKAKGINDLAEISETI
ncbi:MAG: response regulator [Bacillota bacterium]